MRTKYAKTKYAAKVCVIRPRSHIRMKPTYGNAEGGIVTKVHTSTSFSHFKPMSVLCSSLKKHVDHNKTRYAVKMCELCPVRIKTTYRNGESDSLCGKICDMHTFEKCVNNAAIA